MPWLRTALGDAARGRQNEVHTCRGRAHGTLADAAEGFEPTRFQSVGDCHALVSQPAPQFVLYHGRGQARGPSAVQGRIGRPGEHDQLDAGLDGGRIGSLVVGAQR